MDPMLDLPHGCRSVEELLAFHRARFGDTRMMADGDSGQGGEGGHGAQHDGAATSGDHGGQRDGTPTPADVAQQQGQQEQNQDDDNPWSDPVKAKAEIERLRRDAASANGRARENARTEAAEQARADVAQQIGKALGLIEDGETETVDVERITADLTTAQAAQREAALELALYKAAGPANADAARLLDSRGFMASVADVDPTDADAVKAAVTKAVTDNPSFKANARAAGANSADHAGGPGQQRKDLSLDEAVRSHYGT